MADGVVVIGAGLAGLSAALVLAERGVRVTVLEAGERVGGKLQAWSDQDGDIIEHGCHIWWDRYHNLLRLMAAFGLDSELLTLPPEFSLLRAGGESTLISAEWLRSPAGVAGLIMRLPGLNFADKLATLFGSLHMLGFNWEADYERLDDVSFRSWAAQAGFSIAAIDQFFSAIIPSHFYLPLEEVSAAAILTGRINHFSELTRQVSVLRRDPQSALLEPMVRLIQARGGTVRTRAAVTALEVEGRRMTAVQVRKADDGTERLTARHFISAVDAPAFHKLASPLFPSTRGMAGVSRLRATPVIVARVWLDRPLHLPTLSGHFVGSPLLHTLFHVGAFQPQLAGGGDVIELQMGPVQEYIHLPSASLKQLVVSELRRFIPATEQAGVRKVVVLLHEQGFTGYRVGHERYRPRIRSSVQGLFIAGDWVRVPSPVFAMERATLSALLAANSVLAAEGCELWPVHVGPDARVVLEIAAARQRRRPEAPNPDGP